IKVHRTISPLTTIKTHKQKKRKDDRNHLSSLLLYFKFFIHLCFSYTVSSRPKGRTSRNLTNLRQLDLSHVNLSSEMPQMMISNLTSLRSIRLHGCNLFGRFPRLSPTIRSIDLSVNPHLESSLPEFNGRKIPSSIGNLSHLNILDFGYNNLAGEIPTALFNLTKLSSLSLASNHFTGTLPHNINSLSNLNIFNAASNSFFGTVPSTFFNIPCLESLDLGDNQFSGPLEIGNISSMSKLQSLVLSKNNLTGPIPRSISKLVNLVYLDLSYLNTRGPLDVGIFWHLKSLQQLTLSHINTTIARIDLNAVLSLPLKSLSILDLSGSHVSVENMSSVSTLLSQLIYLFLSGCGITVFPEFISSLQYISMIDLSNNSIKGQVPAWLWRLPELHYAELSYNAINGFKEFPKDVSRTMMMLNLSSNGFVGNIPSSLANLVQLESLDLSHNKLSGHIPRDLADLTSLCIIRVSHNKLVGMIPKSTQFQTQNVSGFEDNAGLSMNVELAVMIRRFQNKKRRRRKKKNPILKFTLACHFLY
ncbi:hypothetical protein HID58_095850, partial [Brassica napus]